MPPIARQLYYRAQNLAAMSRSYETEVSFPVIPTGLTEVITLVQAETLVAIWQYYCDSAASNQWNYYGESYAVVTNPEYGLKCIASYQNRGSYSIGSESDLALLLKKTAWVLTDQGLKCPGMVWTDSKSTRQILKGQVPFLNVRIPDVLCNFFGIKQELTSDTLYDTLVAHAETRENITVECAKQLYRACMICDEVKLYGEKNLVFIPGSSKLWYNCSECLWNDETEVCGNAFQYLSLYYKDSDLKLFFLKQGIRESVDISTYMNLWLDHQKKEEPLPSQIVSKIYKRLVQDYQKIPQDKWHDFCKQAELITEDGKFRPPVEFLFADNSSFEKIFSNFYNISFAYIPPNSKITIKQWRAFYNEFSVKSLSSCVSTCIAEIIVNGADSINKREILTSHAIAMMAAWIFEQREGSKNFSQSYEPKLRGLYDIQEYDISDSFNLIYTLTLPSGLTIKENSQVSAYFDYKGKRLVACRRSNDWKRLLAQGIASFLCPDGVFEGFDNFIELVLGEQNLDRIAEKKWCVPSGFEILQVPIKNDVLSASGADKISPNTQQNPEEEQICPAVSHNVSALRRTTEDGGESTPDHKEKDGAVHTERNLDKLHQNYQGKNQQDLSIPGKNKYQEKNISQSPSSLSLNDTDSRNNKNSSSQTETSCDEENPANSSKSAENILFATPNYHEAINEKFARGSTADDISANNDEDDYENEVLTDEVRQRRKEKVKQELRKSQRNAEANAVSSMGKDHVYKPRVLSYHNRKDARTDIKSWQNFFPEGTLTEEQEKLLSSFAEGDIQEKMNVILAIVHKNDPSVRKDLEEHYHGKCQICHKTWIMANGQPFWIAAYLLPRNKGGAAHSGNALCLCAEHFVKWLHGTITLENGDFTSMIDAIPENIDKPELHFKLAGENVVLRYASKHFCDLKALLEFYEDEQNDSSRQNSIVHLNQKHENNRIFHSFAELDKIILS